MIGEATAPREPRSLARTLIWLAVWRQPGRWFVYSIAFGVVAPLVCFGITTRVATFASWTVPMLAYTLTAVATLLTWFALGRKHSRLDALFAGALAGATIFALACTAIAVPLGLIAVAAAAHEPGIAAIGTLGFLTPPALLAYAVPAGRAFVAAKVRMRMPIVLLGFAASLSVPFDVHAATEFACRRTSRAVVESDRPLDELHLEAWRVLAHGRTWDELVDAYRPLREIGATDTELAQRIERAYQLATGKPLWWRFHD